MSKIYSIITGTGRYIPEKVVKNSDFLNNVFLSSEGEKFQKENEEVIQKFKEITDIEERRHIEGDMVTSDMAALASEKAIESAGIDRESIDYIIVAHNFGDIKEETKSVDMVPSLAARVKAKLNIENPYTVAYDLAFGCPGWVQGMIQADYYLKSGDAKKILVIGAETLSRISDPHDIDSMIYADGAGATIIEARESDEPIGILTHKSRSDANGFAKLLNMGTSYNQEVGNEKIFIKMQGRKLYNYALTYVPPLVKDCMDKLDLGINQIKKVLIHQANAKMDEAMLQRLFKMYNIKVNEIPENVMPMSINKLGNNSVATIPILFDMIMRGDMPEHQINSGEHLVFTSVGAGMNVNAFIYKTV